MYKKFKYLEIESTYLRINKKTNRQKKNEKEKKRVKVKINKNKKGN